MKHYFTYAANDGKHQFYIIAKDNKKVYFLVRLMYLILQFIRILNEKIDTFYPMRKMNLNFGINQELTLLHFGVGFTSGPILPNKKHINILRNAFYNN